MEQLECFHVSDRLHLTLLGDSQEVAQILLLPGQTVLTFSDSVLYSSPQVVLEHSRAWASARTLLTAAVSSGVVQYLGLSRPFSSPILAIDPANLCDDLVVLQSALLCVFQLEPAAVPFPGYICLQGSGTALLQQSSQIIEKALGSGESILVNSRCLLAFTGNTTVEKPEKQSLDSALQPSKWSVLQCTGPGVVYMGGEERICRKLELTSADIRAIASLIIVMLCLVVLQHTLGLDSESV